MKTEREEKKGAARRTPTPTFALRMFALSLSLARFVAAAPEAASGPGAGLLRSLASKAGGAKAAKKDGKAPTTPNPPAEKATPPAVGGAPPGVAEHGGPKGPEPTRHGKRAMPLTRAGASSLSLSPSSLQPLNLSLIISIL